MRVTLLLAALVLAGLPSFGAAATQKPPQPKCLSVAFNAATNTIDLTIQPSTSTPPITQFTAKSVRGGTAVTLSVNRWSTSASGRVVISFPAADFASKPTGTYSFSAAAVNSNGAGQYCSPGVAWTLGRPGAPKITESSLTCEYVLLTYTLPTEAIVGQTGYELLITRGSTSSKVEPYRTSISGGKRLLYFPAAAFPAAALSLKLAIRSALGLGAYSSAFALSRTTCQQTITQLQTKVTQRDQTISQQQTELGSCSNACKATPDVETLASKVVGKLNYKVYYKLAALALDTTVAPDPNNPNAGMTLIGAYNNATSTRTVHKFNYGDLCNNNSQQITATVTYVCDPLSCKMNVTSVAASTCHYDLTIAAAWAC